MKNIFLLKKIISYFSFGKDSFYNYYNIFYKKKKLLFINYNNKNIKNINFLLFFKNYFLIYIIKNFSNNECFLRRTRFFYKEKNLIILKNHHYLEKIEFLLIKIIKKNFFLNLNNIWLKNKNFLVKPYINLFIKKYKKIVDKTNKNIKLNRNFIRCLISIFL